MQVGSEEQGYESRLCRDLPPLIVCTCDLGTTILMPVDQFSRLRVGWDLLQYIKAYDMALIQALEAGTPSYFMLPGQHQNLA